MAGINSATNWYLIVIRYSESCPCVGVGQDFVIFFFLSRLKKLAKPDSFKIKSLRYNESNLAYITRSVFKLYSNSLYNLRNNYDLC